MSKLSIPLNPRDLSVELQRLFNQVPPEKVPAILLVLEKIALEKPEGESFTVGVSSLRYVDKGLEIEPKTDDLLSASGVARFINEKKLLLAIKEVLKGLDFTALLALNAASMRAIGAVQTGTGTKAVPRFKAKVCR